MKTLNLFIWLLTALFISACGGGSSSGTNPSAVPIGGDGSNNNDDDQPLPAPVTTGDFSGFAIHTGEEFTNTSPQNADMTVANVFAIELDHNLLEVAPLKILIHKPECSSVLNFGWEYNLVLVNSVGPTNNPSLASLNLGLTGVKYSPTWVKGSMSQWAISYEDVKDSLTFNCINGKYTIDGLGEGYFNSEFGVLRAIDGAFYIAIKKANQFTSSNVTTGQYKSFYNEKSGGRKTCGASGATYPTSRGSFGDAESANWRLTNSSAVSYGEFPFGEDFYFFIPARDGTYTDYYKHFASCSNSSSSGFYVGAGATLSGKKVGFYTGMEQYQTIDSGNFIYEYQGSSSLIVFVEK